MSDLFDRPKTATDLLIDLQRYRDRKMTDTEIKERWRGMQWSNAELTAWARWQFRENVK